MKCYLCTLKTPTMKKVSMFALGLAAIGVAFLLGPVGALVLGGLLLAGPLGALGGANLRARNDRSRTAHVLAATADTDRTPPAGALHRRARAAAGRTFGGRMVAARNGSVEQLDTRRARWRATPDTLDATTADPTLDCPSCAR